jgi:hypothetical protein
LAELRKPQRWSTIFIGVEPPHRYVHEASSSVVHHEDYLNRRTDYALCGVVFENPTTLDPTARAVAVCPECEMRLVEYHLKWWRAKAEAATAELDALRVRYEELATYVDDQRPEAAGLPDHGQVGSDSSDEHPESRPNNDEEQQAGSTADQGKTMPTPLLDQARKELLELCRRFDGAVPFWRVKKSMDALTDKLNSHERVLLAQEIGADGSFMRWCTTEIESHGWQVTNNPVHGDANAMMDAWTEDLYQTPKSTKWRLGRRRLHNGR